MNKLDKDYQALLQDILDNGVEKKDRTGTGTISVFGKQIRHKMSDGFPLLTTKKMAWKSMVTELLWFLRGDTNIKYLVDNGCHIWDGDVYKNYEKTVKESIDRATKEGILKEGDDYDILSKETFIDRIKTDADFAKKWGDLGKIYGRQWRYWNDGIDQISELIKQLKENPDSRRLLVTAWNPSDLDASILPPCHYGFQVYTRELKLTERLRQVEKLGLLEEFEKELSHSLETNTDHEIKEFRKKFCDKHNIPTRAISLMWNQRSVDTFLGLPFNIASYGLLLEIIAKVVNMVPEELIGNLGDVHLYSNHIEQAKEQIGRELTAEERYNIWFDNNYETGMERYFDANNLPDFNDEYYEPTPTRTREPYPLPTLNINTEWWPTEGGECGVGPLDAVAVFNGLKNDNFCKCLLEEDIQLSNYQSHPTIKAPLSN